jgi:hypothetical protein
VIPISIYAAPVPGGRTLVVPAAAVDQIGGVAALLQRHPDSVRVDVLAPAGPPIPDLQAMLPGLLARAAAAAALPAAAPRRGPHGRWYAALVAWGWLLVLAADGHMGQVLAGLWLGAGLPLVRAAYTGGVLRWAARAAAGYLPVLAPVEVRHLEHDGLTRIAAAVAEHEGAPQSAFEAAAALCAVAGPIALQSFYRELSEGTPASGIWIAAPLAVAGTGGAPTAGVAEEEGVVPPQMEAAAVATDREAPGPRGPEDATRPDGVAGPNTEGADVGAPPEGEQPRTSSTPLSAPTA